MSGEKILFPSLMLLKKAAAWSRLLGPQTSLMSKQPITFSHQILYFLRDGHVVDVIEYRVYPLLCLRLMVAMMMMILISFSEMHCKQIFSNCCGIFLSEHEVEFQLRKAIKVSR